jgi:aromatic-L-amino-acid decarboxylase
MPCGQKFTLGERIEARLGVHPSESDCLLKGEKMTEDILDNPDMSDETFRKALGQVGEWVSSYRQKVGDQPVLSRVEPGFVLNSLPAAAPLQGESVELWLKDLEEIILPGVTHWNHPGFMAYFGTTGSGPGILGELVSAALNTNGMLWKTCPALTELEQVVLRWYASSLGLPADWFGMFADTASTSSLIALAAAREAAGLAIREEGLSGKPPLVLYCSEEAHSSIDKAALVLGLGMSGIRRISADSKYRMQIPALEEAILKDRAENRRPFAVVATVGTTSATAVDPVPELADLCQKYGLWLHVDAAYAGTAAVAPEFRWALKGCERADSFVTNPHKWLFTPIDCSALYTRKSELLRQAFSVTPEYLRTDTADAINLMDYSFQLGRRFRAIKLWFVFRYFGTEGIAKRIREHVRLARCFADWVDTQPHFERLADVDFSVVCFRFRPEGVKDEATLEKLNSQILEKVNASGEVYLSHTKLKGRYCLRVAIGNLMTREKHLKQAFALVQDWCQVLKIQF